MEEDAWAAELSLTWSSGIVAMSRRDFADLGV
jgi:hypothetical protein